LSKLLFDPQACPVESVAEEGPLESVRLSATWIRERFVSQAAWTPEVVAEPRLHDNERVPVPAAVLIPLVVHEQGATLLFTRRTAHLTDHAGQISFPGGRMESQDRNAVDTALRETEEEIGLQERHIEVLGVLPDYLTATGYQVSPVVAIVRPPFVLKADAFEVAEIFEVPLAFLMDGSRHQRRSLVLPGIRRTFYAMPYEDYFIWGATAGMVRNLFHFLRA
jgi:8-oxo-dGTP pyrophosphatase MutT (NUDIX family)